MTKIKPVSVRGNQNTRTWVRAPRVFALLLLFSSLVAIFHTWTTYDQTWDENDQIAGGMEWLYDHSFSIDPVDPPLPPILDAIGPTALGLGHTVTGDPWKSGNEILSEGSYHLTLYAARAGTLLFFLFAEYLVYTRGRELSGEWGACLGLAIFGSLPSVIAHSSLATTDASMFAMLFWAFDRIWRFIRNATRRNAVLAGVAAALAMVSKLTAVPCIIIAIVCLEILWLRRGQSTAEPKRVAISKRLLVAIICGLAIWATYFCSFGSIAPPGSQDRAKLTALMERHHMSPAIPLAFVSHLPAPEFFAGLRAARAIGKNSGHYWLLGRNRTHATRLFFPVMFLAKMPIPFTALFLIGSVLAVRNIRKRREDRETSGDLYIGVLVIGAFVPLAFGIISGVNLGMRHILGMVPFAALLAGLGAIALWRQSRASRVVVAVLLAWFAVDAAWAARDPLPWYNELARQMPHGGAWFEPGSDYDWGQDLKRLPAALAQHHVQHFWFAYNGSADLGRAGLPDWEPLPPHEHVHGWVVMSGAYTVGQSYGWLNAYQPVARVGGTMRLYWIPPQPGLSGAGPG